VCVTLFLLCPFNSIINKHTAPPVVTEGMCIKF